MTGKIYDSKSFFLREMVGTATDPETNLKYELTTSCINRHPLVHSLKTGKFFLLPWEDILRMAIKAGIDQE